MKRLVFKKQKDYWKLPIGIIIIILAALAPLWIGMVGATITEFITGNQCNEGNCFWGVLPWLMMATIPIGAIILVVFLIIALIDFIKIRSNKSVNQ
ncbi:hypothetical protein D7030_03880 [Flavobacteriaceae bacterium AU392]|nr:hypothetical protein D1817_10355 [Flavobacteriaceae bacterium]RKM85815.1 hypothetical protein D7030_03880 [Flavobacteriaceae bacterium AU392]